mmetsp:Transcript_57942/g.166148  ORF Transcript_57942/g.166148 Transcript_57942/m.166148 type:complete len:250 (-) Transcript_57942:1107-1856(-)
MPLPLRFCAVDEACVGSRRAPRCERRLLARGRRTRASAQLSPKWLSTEEARTRRTSNYCRLDEVSVPICLACRVAHRAGLVRCSLPDVVVVCMLTRSRSPPLLRNTIRDLTSCLGAHPVSDVLPSNSMAACVLLQGTARCRCRRCEISAIVEETMAQGYEADVVGNCVGSDVLRRHRLGNENHAGWRRPHRPARALPPPAAARARAVDLGAATQVAAALHISDLLILLFALAFKLVACVRGIRGRLPRR